MLAIQVNEVGDENKLIMNRHAPIPSITTTQCLIENHYAGLNFHDTYTRSGLYPLPLPFIVGCEGGGIVKEVGNDVTVIKPGDRVVYLQDGIQGSYAEYTNVEFTRLMPVPDDVELDVATAAAVQGLTAHYLVNDSYNIQKGDWCVIHAAAGGTGQILVQMAKGKGARVIGTCSNKHKADIAKNKGCDFVIVTKSKNDKDESTEEDDVWPKLADMVRDIIRENSDEPILPSNYGAININDGAHVVFDSVGKNSALASLECLRPRGTAVFFGNASGSPPDINPLLLSRLGSLTITRPKLHDFIQTREEVVQRSDAVFQMLKRNELHLHIQEKILFGREDVIRGTKMLQGRKTVGKVLFDVRQGLQLHQKLVKASESIRSSRKAPMQDKISSIGSDIVPQTLGEAYKLQDLVKNDILLENETTKVVGKKIAATSIMAQKSVSVNEPFYGNLFSHSTFASGAKISTSDVSLGFQEGFLIIEPEFAVRMNSDTEAGTKYSPETIKHLIGSIIPSVEIATSAFIMPDLEAFKKVGAPSLIADNACHGALILGDEYRCDSSDRVVDSLDELTCWLELNGNTVANGSGRQVLGHPVNALCWLANALGERGEILKKGDVISTGVCVDQLVLANRGDSVTVDYGTTLGKVTFKLE
jgi:NADPH2:quinone reductase